MAALAASLKAAQASGQGSLASALAGLLVHMGQASAATQAALLDHFSAALDLAAMDAAAPSSSPHQVCRPCLGFRVWGWGDTCCPSPSELRGVQGLGKSGHGPHQGNYAVGW